MWDQISIEEKRDSVKDALEWSDEELFDTIAASLFTYELQKGVTQAPWDLKEKLRRVQEFFSANKNTLKNIICKDLEFCERRYDPEFMDPISLGVTIADSIFITLTKSPIPPFTISIYIIRKGLDKFCKC